MLIKLDEKRFHIHRIYQSVIYNKHLDRGNLPASFQYDCSCSRERDTLPSMLPLKLSAALLILLIVQGCTTPKQSSTVANDDADKAAVLQTMRDWADGYLKHDPVRLDRVRDDDWTYSGDSGVVVTKEEADKMFQTDTTKYLSFDYEELKPRIYGNAAVVNGREKMRWESGGKEDSASYRITAMFVKRGNQWRCVASHSSLIPKGK